MHNVEQDITALSARPASRGGLYAAGYEHDACGVGMICSLKGEKSHTIVENGLQILVNLTHRGACGCDESTGDGAGILMQIPHRFLRRVGTEAGIRVPDEKEYRYLIKTLKDLGYQNISGWGWQREGELYSFDLFTGKRIHTTELLDSPLEDGRHILIKKFSRIYVGILNYYDLIASKLFRGDSFDFEDCLMLIKAKPREIDL